MIKRIVDQDGFILKPFDEKLGISRLTSDEVNNNLMALKSHRLSEVSCLLADTCRIECIIETGTFKGKGTTNSYAYTGLPIYSCELNKENYEDALKNIGFLRHVHIDHAFSINKKHIQQEQIDKIGVEKIPDYDNWLVKMLHDNKNKRVMVSLDSDRRNGGKEFEIIKASIDLYDNIRCIILDDLNSSKHSRTPDMLEKEYGIDVYQVEDRWGFAVVPSANWDCKN